MINLGLIVGLVGTHKALAKEFDPDDSRWSTAKMLYWGAIVGGVGMLLIRFTSNAAWWTGHLRYGLDYLGRRLRRQSFHWHISGTECEHFVARMIARWYVQIDGEAGPAGDFHAARRRSKGACRPGVGV